MIFHTGEERLVLDFPQDKDSKKLYTVYFRPPQWQPNTVYITGKDYVLPTTFNGFYYLAKSGGVSGSTEPNWPCKKGELVLDNCVEWKTIPYDLLLNPSDSIVSVTWTSPTPEVIIDTPVNTADSSSALVSFSGMPSDGEAIVEVTATLSTGEIYNRSFVIKVKDV